MTRKEALSKIKEVEQYLQNHRNDSSVSGHFDTVPGKLADDFSEAIKLLIDAKDTKNG